MSRVAVHNDHATISEALRLLALADDSGSAALVETISSTAGRRLLERTAVHQGMDSALMSMLDTHGLESSHWLRSRAETVRLTRLSSKSILARIDRCLTAREIPWVAMKGPVVAHRYNRPEVRSFNDVDILVQPQSFADSLDALSEAGFEDINRNWENYLRYRIAETPLLAPGASIDLHWHVIAHGARRSGTTIDIDGMLDRRRRVELDHVEVPIFDPEDLLLHVALHAALSGGTRLLWLWDIRELVRAEEIDWDVFRARTASTGAGARVGQVLDRSRIVLGSEIPTTVVESLCPRPLLALRRVVDERDDGGGLPKRFLRGFPVAASRNSLRDSLTAAVGELARRVRPGPGWDVADPEGPLFWQRKSGGRHAKEEYLAWVGQAGEL